MDRSQQGPSCLPVCMVFFLLSMSFPQAGKGPWQPVQVDVQAPAISLDWGAATCIGPGRLVGSPCVQFNASMAFAFP